jgi:LysM repeat protein
MAARKPARYLAPVALIAVAVAIFLIVQARTQSHRSTPPVARHSAHILPGTRHTTKSTKPLFYVIKPGDSLSTISVKTGVPIDTLTALNPGLNPAALQSGQRLRLRR